MDRDESRTTDIWQQYSKGKNYLRMKNVYRDTDINYKFYNGNQWEGASVSEIAQVQYNFIETIVNYKVSTVNQNLYGINFSSEKVEK